MLSSTFHDITKGWIKEAARAGVTIHKHISYYEELVVSLGLTDRIHSGNIDFMLLRWFLWLHLNLQLKERITKAELGNQSTARSLAPPPTKAASQFRVCILQSADPLFAEGSFKGCTHILPNQMGRSRLRRTSSLHPFLVLLMSPRYCLPTLIIV